MKVNDRREHQIQWTAIAIHACNTCVDFFCFSSTLWHIVKKQLYFLPRKNHTIRNDTCRTTVWSRIFGAVYPANARDLTVHWCAEPLWAAKVVVKKSCHVFWAWFLKKRCARPVMAVAINQDGGRESGFTCMDRWCKQRDPKNDDGTPAHHEQLHF